MKKLRSSRTPKIALLAAALAVAALALGGVAGATTSKRVAKAAPNATLGKTVLTTLGGRTLYSLSAEKNGTFICKGSSCLRDWHPLYVAAGTKPTGPTKLGTIVRPDNGRRQVTAHGLPLYTFDDDEKPGDANGEGIEDVGTWHAATP